MRAAKVEEVRADSGAWAFVDLGFSEKAKSCALLLDDGGPQEMTFADLRLALRDIVASDSKPLNLLLEAPLSVAFNRDGNPTGRSIERRGSEHRYWYIGLGCSVLVAATFLVHSLSSLRRRRDVRLVEGLASFKPKGAPSSHAGDVLALRDVAWSAHSPLGRIVDPAELAKTPTDRVVSAFAHAGLDLGIPPVVALGAQQEASRGLPGA